MAKNLSMFIPLTKVNAEKREVWGRATQQVLDGHDEVMDYQSSMPYFKAWSDLVEKRTSGKSKGNVREMHQPIAAGKLIAIDFNDAEKAVDIGTYVSDDSTWRKVLDGTLTGFSIGGDYVKRWMDSKEFPGKTRYTAQPHEISLVDMPAVPTATFQMVKDGVSQTMQFQKNLSGTTSVPIAIEVNEVVEHAESTTDLTSLISASEPVFVETLEKSHQVDMPGSPNMDAGVPGVMPDGDAIIIQANTEGVQPPDEPVIQEVLNGDIVTQISADGGGRPSPEDSRNHPVDANWQNDFKNLAKEIGEKIIKLENLFRNPQEEQLSVLKLRSSRVGINRREGEPLTATQNNPADWTVYGDPVNWKFPVTKGVAITTLIQYNARKSADLYSPREWNIVGRRIARLTSETFGMVYKFNSTNKKVELIKEKNMTTLNKAGSPMELLAEAKNQLNAACEMIGADPSAAKDLLMQVMAAMDVAGDMSLANPASGASPSLGGPSSSVANAAPSGSLEKDADVEKAKKAPATATETVDETTPMEKAVEPAVIAKADDEGSDEGTETETGSYEKEIQKALTPMLELINKQSEALSAMTTQVEEMKKMQDNPWAFLNGTVPAGDLAGITKAPAEDSALQTALEEGNLNKALDAVGNDANRMYQETNDLVIQQLVNSGMSVRKWHIFPGVE